MEGYDGIVVL